MAELNIVEKDGNGETVVGSVLVDDDLLPVLKTLPWRLMTSGHVVRTLPMSQVEALSYFIWKWHNQGTQVPPGHYLDHWNKDLRDYQYAILFIADGSEVSANHPLRSSNSTGWRCTELRKNGRYSTRVRRKERRVNGGTFSTAIEAAYAVKIAFEILYPRLPAPNQIPDDALSESRKDAVRAIVHRRLQPDRKPFER